MSATYAHPYLMPRTDNLVLNYLSIDFAVVGLASLLLLASVAASNMDQFRPSEKPASISSSSAKVMVQGEDDERPNLTPAMTAALESVAQRYRISPEALQPIFAAAQSAGRKRNLDPLLIVAIIGIESGFNPLAQSVMGAQGLMQIIPRYHQDKLPKESAKATFLDPVSNVRIGAQVLQEAIRRQGGEIEGLQYYAGAADDPETAYANRVIAEKQRLDQAARRKDLTGNGLVPRTTQSSSRNS